MKASPLFLLFIVFLVLKLCGVIAWSWWWVTAPLWIPLAVGLTIWIGIWLFVLVIAIGSHVLEK